MILFLVGRNLPQDLFNHFAKADRKLWFYYFITKEPTKEFERNFSKWAKSVLRIRREELNNFVKKIQPCNHIERKRIQNIQFTETRQNNLQQYRIRYILAKLHNI